MRVILTHEQADFDALASLFGAHLVDESSLAVLPRRMNRNVRSFITLYGAEFPFVDPRDLPSEPVEAVTLVDTQSLVTLKGMNKKTAIFVVDHHAKRKDLPKSWDLSILPTGATTTYFVEIIQERGEPLSAIQATLLLLGVYEDTGQLTYVSTTPRDVRAAAYLLEHGASLRVASDFINPPLSEEQRKVYDRLVDSAETIEESGHRIMIASTVDREMTEEISTLAHKLRDLFDPDALFVLVLTSEGVRLVARSTSDRIDVADIAAQFGGGGHDRASAALIRPAETGPQDEELLSKAKADLLDLLPRFVRPSITVAQIMSKRPRVLSPDTPAQEAASMMQRYGYEGFPVVSGGKVVGLLTRRAVDRAVAHKLNLPAASLMEAGEVNVHPGDSLQVLQTLMTNSGWGQIPVVEPARNEIIGIVTRTDLIKTLSLHPTHPTRENLSEKLVKALPHNRMELIRAVAACGSEHRVALYIVGGFVRDLLLGRPSQDFDVVVEGDAVAIARAVAEKYGGRVTTHSRFGTAKWFLRGSKFGNRGLGSGRGKRDSIKDIVSADAPGNPDFLDFISARIEYYERPTALPTVERGSIKLDLHRRDFTFNTLAIRLDGHHFGELHDYWGGLADLKNGLVRVLHSLSFVDDPTRILRAVRFEQRFGFSIEERTLQLISEAHELISKLSEERTRHELDLIMDEENNIEMISRLYKLSLLKAIHPDLPWNDSVRQSLAAASSSTVPAHWLSAVDPESDFFRRTLCYLLWLVSLTPRQISSIHNRLRFPTPIYKAILAANQLNSDLRVLRGAKPSAWVNRLEDIPTISVYAIYLISDEVDRATLHEYITRWMHIKPFIDGHVLRKMGIPPGPQYQRILGRLRAAWLDGEISTQDEEKELLKTLLPEPD